MTKLEKAAYQYATERTTDIGFPSYNIESEISDAFEAGAQWQKEQLWKDAQGSDLPEYDREVVVLCDDNHGDYKICYGHRPDPEGWDGINPYTKEKEHFDVCTYKGGWSTPDVRWWLDLPMPYDSKEAGPEAE